MQRVIVYTWLFLIVSEFYCVWYSAQCKTNVKVGSNQIWMLAVIFSTRQMDQVVVPGWLNLPRYLTVAVMGTLTVYYVICACWSYLQGSRCSGHLDRWGWEQYSVPKHQLQTNLIGTTVSQGICFQEGQDFFFLKPPHWHWGAPTVLYETDARENFPGGKAVAAWGWPLSLHFMQSLRMNGSVVRASMAGTGGESCTFQLFSWQPYF